jgi:hypothetical protein
MNRLRILLVSAISLASSAQAQSLDGLLYRPDQGAGSYFITSSPRLLKQYQVAVSSDLHFQAPSLQLREDGRSRQDVVGRGWIQYLAVATSFHERWLQLGVSLPVVWNLEYRSPTQFPVVRESLRAAGDVAITTKTRLGADWKSDSGFALITQIQAPTGNDSQYLGAGTPVLGAGVAGEWRLTDLDVGFQTTALFRKTGRFRNVQQSHQWAYSVAAAWHYFSPMSVVIDMYGRTRLTEPFGKLEDNPLELLLGARFQSPFEDFRFHIGGGLGLVRGAGIPPYRILMGFQWTPG